MILQCVEKEMPIVKGGPDKNPSALGTFFFRNQPAPKKYLGKGFSPLHARIMALYDSLQDGFHRIWFDNLYMAAKFALASFQHQKKVMVDGVTRTHVHGLCNEVLQMKVKGNERM